MIIVKCIEKVRDKNNVITDYILEDCNGMRQILSSDQVKGMIKHGWLNILNLKLTSDGKLIDNQDYNINFEGVRNQRSWEESYETLRRAINNGVKVIQPTVYEGINIGNWLSHQRILFKKGRLPEDKIQKLEELGLELGSIRKSWDEYYETLCRAINNGVKITNTTVYEGVNIGKWVANQRQLFKYGELSEDRIKKLNNEGLKLGVPRRGSRPWDENYRTLCKAINNGVKITSTTVYEGVNIGTWLNNQRALLKSGELSEDKAQKLKELDLAFNQRKESSWNENCETLCKALNNGVKITQSTVYEGVNIGKWVSYQRQLFKNGGLPEDKIQKLKDTGLELEIRRVVRSWDESYKTLCRAINNGVKITNTTVYEGIQIGKWLHNQRTSFKLGKLSEDKIQKFKDIGLELGVMQIHRSWNENYEILCTAIDNGVKITSTTVYEGVNLGIWIGNQRQNFKNGKLPEYKIEKLRKIGVIE